MTRATLPSVQSDAVGSLSMPDTSDSARARIRAEASGPSSSAMQESIIATPTALTPTSSAEAGYSDRSDMVVIPAAGQDAPDASIHAERALGKALPIFQTGGSAIDLLISLIDATGRLRPVNPAAVEDLAVSIAEGSLAHPITVRPLGGGRFQLVVGAHRLAAFVRLGRMSIPAQVRVMTDHEARQLEIDENLVRSGLTALERLTFMAERVEVWAARNPDKVVMDATQPIKLRGRPPKAFLKLRKVDGYVPAMMGFVAETARDTGLSKQGIYRAVQALSALPAHVRDRLHGTWIAKNDAALRQLAGIGDAAEQGAVLDVLLAGKTKNIAEARAIAAGTPVSTKAPVNTIQRDFEKAWKAAAPSQRDAMLTWLSGQRLPDGWAISGGDA